MNYLEKNIEAVGILREAFEFDEEQNISVEINGANERYYIYDGEKQLQIGSMYQNRYAADAWAEQFEKVETNSILYIFGIGNIAYIEAVMKAYPDNVVILYEPCDSVARDIFTEYDLTDILTNGKVLFAVGLRKDYMLEQYVTNIISFSNIKKTRSAVIPNYPALFGEQYEKYLKLIRVCQEKLLYSRNTTILDEASRARCYFGNLLDAVRQSRVNVIERRMRDIDVSDVPAIIVSAGPSLDKNIDKLKQATGKAYIICVDTALKAVTDSGVTPDILVCIDPEKNPSLFDVEGADRIPLLLDLYCNNRLIRKHKGRHFYFATTELLLEDIWRQYGKAPTNKMDSGGSVANTAFSLAVLMGFEKIILIGQDLAYPQGQVHTKSAFDGKEELDMKRLYVETEDINGNMVMTEENMNFYRCWFERQIEQHTRLNVVDATEGGALIHGSRVMTLEDAVHTYCVKERDSRLDSVLDNAEYTLNPQQQEEAERTIREILDNMEELRRELKEKRKIYETLQTMNVKRQYQKAGFKKAAEGVQQNNEWLRNDLRIKMLNNFNHEAEYKVQDMIGEADEEKPLYEEIKLITDSGLHLIESYIDATYQVEKLWKEVEEEQNGEE